METILQAITYMATIWIGISWFRKGLTYLPTKISDKIESYLCGKCLTFWITLIITQNPPVAVIAALIAAVMDNTLSTTKL